MLSTVVFVSDAGLERNNNHSENLSDQVRLFVCSVVHRPCHLVLHFGQLIHAGNLKERVNEEVSLAGGQAGLSRVSFRLLWTETMAAVASATLVMNTSGNRPVSQLLIRPLYS